MSNEANHKVQADNPFYAYLLTFLQSSFLRMFNMWPVHCVAQPCTGVHQTANFVQIQMMSQQREGVHATILMLAGIIG